MFPNFLPNSFVFTIYYPLQKFKVGDVILVNHHQYGKMIKRIDSISDDSMTIMLKGDNPQSVTTEQMGEINTTQIIGKVNWHIKPPQAH